MRRPHGKIWYDESVLQREHPWHNHDDVHGLTRSEKRASVAEHDGIHGLTRSERRAPSEKSAAMAQAGPSMMTSMLEPSLTRSEVSEKRAAMAQA